MSRAAFVAIVGIGLAAVAGVVWLALSFEPPEGVTTVVLEPAPSPDAEEGAAAAGGRSSPSVLPEIRIRPQAAPAAPAAPEPPPDGAAEESAPPEPPVRLPELNASDGFVLERLRALENGMAMARQLTDGQFVRRFVVLAENLSRGELPQTEPLYRTPGREMPARGVDDGLFVMDGRAHARFDRFVDAFAALDADAAVGLYRTLSPLFRRAYAELGHRGADFDQTLRAAIRRVLRAEPPAGPHQLVKPSVMYLYADAGVENLDQAHKQLIRLGPDNARRVKAKLREILERL